MADERIVSVKLEQIEQYYGELREKQQSLRWRHIWRVRPSDVL